MEYYLSNKKELTINTTSMNLKSNMLSEGGNNRGGRLGVTTKGSVSWL